MAILKIARMGHPVLRRRAEEVADPTTPEIQALVRDMIETMGDARGIGLAAPQVHVAKRLVVFFIPSHRTEEAAGENIGDDAKAGAVELTVLINPVLTPLTEEKELGIEACLSVPGLCGVVPRYARLRYRGVTPEGRTVDRIASGFHARVVQHECDHLDGILYPMRMTDLSTLAYTETMGEVEEGRAPGAASEAVAAGE